jgi:hypothetical protein
MSVQEIQIDHNKTLEDYIKKTKERIKRLKDRCKDRK